MRRIEDGSQALAGMYVRSVRGFYLSLQGLAGNADECLPTQTRLVAFRHLLAEIVAAIATFGYFGVATALDIEVDSWLGRTLAEWIMCPVFLAMAYYKSENSTVTNHSSLL